MADASTAQTLFSPFEMPGLSLANRFVMAPMSRRFSPGGVPGEMVADYYHRRAAGGAGLILTEATYIDHPGAGMADDAPDFHGEQAAAGWRAVVERVHEAGAKIFPQVWHIGSVRKHADPADVAAHTISPSGLNLRGEEYGRTITLADIDEVIASYVRAARLAEQLGFDGIEIHAAHGYLIDQFLWKFTNRRTDDYGPASPASRARFAVEVVRAVRAAVSADYPVSFRFSQWKSWNYDARIAETPQELEALLAPIAAAGVSLMHSSTRRFWQPEFEGSERTLASWTREVTGLPTISVGSVGLSDAYTQDPSAPRPTSTDLTRATEHFHAGDFDLLAVGRAILANPDWVAKMQAGRQDDLTPYAKSLESQLF